MVINHLTRHSVQVYLQYLENKSVNSKLRYVFFFFILVKYMSLVIYLTSLLVKT